MAKAVAMGEERDSETTIIKQSLIVRRRQAQQDDNRAQEATIESRAIRFAKKDTRVAKDDRGATETIAGKGRTRGTAIETEVLNPKTRRGIGKELTAVKGLTCLKAQTSVRVREAKVIVAESVTEGKIRVVAEGNGKSKRVLTVETKGKVTATVQTVT
jgi:hypothetical protein